MLESNERSDCKAAGFRKHVVGIALTRMFPVIPIRAELCWLYLTGVFELTARSRTGDIGAEIVWSQSLCLKPRPQPRCRRSTKPCEQISTSSIIHVCLKKGLGLRACGSLYTKFWYVWATHPHLTTKSIGLFLSVQVPVRFRFISTDSTGLAGPPFSNVARVWRTVFWVAEWCLEHHPPPTWAGENSTTSQRESGLFFAAKKLGSIQIQRRHRRPAAWAMTWVHDRPCVDESVSNCTHLMLIFRGLEGPLEDSCGKSIDPAIEEIPCPSKELSKLDDPKT